MALSSEAETRLHEHGAMAIGALLECSHEDQCRYIMVASASSYCLRHFGAAHTTLSLPQPRFDSEDSATDDSTAEAKDSSLNSNVSSAESRTSTEQRIDSEPLSETGSEHATKAHVSPTE